MQQHLEQQANVVEEVLAAQGIRARAVGGSLSPRLIHFTLELPPRTRLRSLTPALPELAERLGVEAVRLAPDSDTGAPTLEVPRPDPVAVPLLPLARSVADTAPPCTVTLGRDVTGAPLLLRLDAPEVGPVLVVGERGTGKSALLRGMAVSLGLLNGPDTLRMLLLDMSGPGRRAPRRGAWSDIGALPHLVAPPVCEVQEARLRLRWAARLAESRAEQAQAGEPIEGPNLVVLIDGFDALLAGRGGDEIAEAVRMIAAGRDLGVQLVAAASDPAAGKLLGWGARVVGCVSDVEAAGMAAGLRGTGAEGLLAGGDFLAVLGGDVTRLQACFVTPAEAAQTAELLRGCAAGENPIERRSVWQSRRPLARLLKFG